MTVADFVRARGIVAAIFATESAHHSIPEVIEDTATVQNVDLQTYDTFLYTKGGHAV